MADATSLAERFLEVGQRVSRERRLATQPRLDDWTESAVAPPAVPGSDDPELSHPAT